MAAIKMKAEDLTQVIEELRTSANLAGSGSVRRRNLLDLIDKLEGREPYNGLDAGDRVLEDDRPGVVVGRVPSAHDIVGVDFGGGNYGFKNARFLRRAT